MMGRLPPRDPRENSIFRFFINQHVFINMIYVLVISAGLILWFKVLNREAFGNFDFDVVQITTPYLGATAEEVENLITIPLENALKTVEGIDEMGSISVEGVSAITIQLDPDGRNKTKTVRDIEREVDRIRTTDLPENGDEPQVVEVTAAFPVITIGLSGDVPPMELRRVADKLEDDLLDIDGVSRISMRGFKDKEIWVETDPQTLRQAHLSLLDLINSIRQGDHTSPGGRIETGSNEIIVRTLAKLETVDDVKQVVVRSNEQQNNLTVGEVAQVTERLERERKYTRMNGARSIELNVLKKDSGDTLKIDKAIKELINNYRETENPSINYGYANEISFYINRRLEVLVKNGMFGIVFILLIMLLFLKPQSAFWTTTAIPFAFLGGLIVMYFAGLTINLLSLFAFIMVSGMLVDNGIVVSEYIEQKREEGLPQFTAVSVGISEMAIPVFAAGITTIIAFGTLAFMSGITGKFLRQMPLVLVACLVADLLECLFILPGHLQAYDWNIRLPKHFEAVRTKAQNGLAWLTARYEKILHRVAENSVKTMASVSAFFLIFMVILAFNFRFEIFPRVIDAFVITFELPVGTSLDRTTEVAKEFEKIVSKIPSDEIEAVLSQIGTQGQNAPGEQSNSGTNVGEVRVFLNKAKPDRIPGQELMESIRKEATEFAKASNLDQFELEGIRGGPPTGRAIEVQLIGREYAPLIAWKEKTTEFLKSQEGTLNINDDYDEGKDELRLTVDRAAAARASITPAQIAMVIRSAFDGQEATEIKRVGETTDVEVVVKLKESFRESDKTIDQLTITNPRGLQIPLNTLIKRTSGKGLLTILHVDGNRAITVRGDIDPDVTTSNDVNVALQTFLNDYMKEHPGIHYKFSGEKESQDESIQSLLVAIATALFLIYLVLATLFRSYWEPVIILSVIPFALMGSILAMMIGGKIVTLLVLIGFTGLTGVVVNNSILLLETFNRNRRQKDYTIHQAAVSGAVERLRPILLTTVSTFSAVMPLGYGLGGKEPFLQDMAYAFGWGLLFCAIVTLFWIPAFYVTSMRVKGYFTRTSVEEKPA